MSNKEFKVIGDPMDCLAEECAEVIKALMKIKRFGIEGHPGKPMKDGVRISNRDELLEEMQDCEDRLNEVRAILGASRDSRILSDVSVEQLVNKFLKWQLPASVSSDQCVTQPGLTNRTGTNLLTYIEATQMIEHLLADVR